MQLSTQGASMAISYNWIKWERYRQVADLRNWQVQPRKQEANVTLSLNTAFINKSKDKLLLV